MLVFRLDISLFYSSLYIRIDLRVFYKKKLSLKEGGFR